MSVSATQYGDSDQYAGEAGQASVVRHQRCGAADGTGHRGPIGNGIALCAAALLVTACASGPTSAPDDRPFDGPDYSAHYQGTEIQPAVDPERYLPRPDASTPPAVLPVGSAPTARRTDGASGDPLRVHVLNVGTGSCAIAECPGSDDLLVFDCGSTGPSGSDMSRGEIAGFLERIGANGKLIVTISHPHEDHYNRIVALMGDRQAESVWLGGEFAGYGGEGPDRVDSWLDAQAAAGAEIYHGFPAAFANRGKPVEALRCGDASTYILTANVGETPNANSMMLLLEFGEFRMVFSGDAEGATEESAIANFGALIEEVSVLSASNHGADTRSSNDRSWTRKTRPQTVIFSTGLAHRFPTKTAGNRYMEHVFDDVYPHPMWWNPNENGLTATFETTHAVYATELSGTITVESDGRAFSLTCEKNGSVETCF